MYIIFTFPGRLKREVDPTEAKPESPPKPQQKPKPPRTPRTPRTPPRTPRTPIIENQITCNSQNKGGKQCKIWSINRCLNGKDISSKECQKSRGDSGSQGHGAAGGVILVILFFVHL